MIWRDRYRNVELTHFQEEMMAWGLAIKHLEVNPIPEVADTCLGFTAVAMAEVFSDLEKHDKEVTPRPQCEDIAVGRFRPKLISF